MHTTARIPILDLAPETEALWDELNAAIQDVMRSGSFIMGPQVNAFEREVASYLGVKHAIGLNSGTDALVIGLRALGVGPGDEVITSPFTFFATAEAISMVGATPVFVDIEADTFNVDVALIEERITDRTRAIIPVHLFGLPADMDGIMAVAAKHGLKVLEDTAQAFGARYDGRMAGTIGDVGAYSFFPSKNLGCFGDGGLLTTDDDRVAAAAAMLRTHGSSRKYHNEQVGYNSRLDEIQAAILRVKLPHLEANNAKRRQVADCYSRALGQLEGLVVPRVGASASHVFHQYTVRIGSGMRDAVEQALSREGIGTMVYYPVPVHRLPVYASLRYSLPVAEQAAGEVLSLPMAPELDPSAQERIVAATVRAIG